MDIKSAQYKLFHFQNLYKIEMVVKVKRTQYSPDKVSKIYKKKLSFKSANILSTTRINCFLYEKAF